MSASIDVLTVLESAARSLWVEGEPVNPHAAELIAARAAVAELIEATTALRARLCLHGDWEDRCFYYNGYSAPELMAPMADVDAALARVKGGAA